MKISWIDYSGIDNKGQPLFTIYRADDQILGIIRSQLSKSTREAVERGAFAEAGELIETIKEIDEQRKKAEAEALQEDTNG